MEAWAPTGKLMSGPLRMGNPRLLQGPPRNSTSKTGFCLESTHLWFPDWATLSFSHIKKKQSNAKGGLEVKTSQFKKKNAPDVSTSMKLNNCLISSWQSVQQQQKHTHETRNLHITGGFLGFLRGWGGWVCVVSKGGRIQNLQFYSFLYFLYNQKNPRDPSDPN